MGSTPTYGAVQVNNGFGSKSLCGLRPTGRLHLGHYFAVIQPAIQGATVLIANYHAPQEQAVEPIIEILFRHGIHDIVRQKDIFDAEIRAKVRAATMDDHGTINMKSLYEFFIGGDVPASNKEMKEQLSEGLIKRLL